MQLESEKQKTKWFFASLAAMALVINWRFAVTTGQLGLRDASDSPSVLTHTATPTPAPAPQQQVQSPEPAIVIGIGTVMITTADPTEILIGNGESWEVSPAQDVAYEIYINGQFVRQVLPKSANVPPPPQVNRTDAWKIGFRLVPGQGHNIVRLAYVKYRGSGPPSDWYSRAIATASPSAAAPSGVLFADDFNGTTIDPSKWTVSGYNVFQQAGTVHIQTTATDAGGNLTSVPIAVNGSGLITITRQVSLHCGNEFFDGEFGIKIGSMPTCSVRYANMAQLADPKYRACEGFFLTKDDSKPDIIADAMNVSGPVTPVWDKWFAEKVTYNPNTGYMEYFRNDTKLQSFFVGIPPHSDALSMQLHFTAWGWYTGHEQWMQSLKVTQEPGS